MPDRQLLVTLRKVGGPGSVAAANRLNVGQSAPSHTIRKLPRRQQKTR